MYSEKNAIETSEIDYSRIVKFLYILVLSVSMPLIVMTALINSENLMLPANIMFSVTYAAAFICFVFFKKIPRKVHFYVIILSVFIAGIISIAEWKTSGSGVILFISAIVMSAFFLKFSATIIFMCASVIFQIIFMFLPSNSFDMLRIVVLCTNILFMLVLVKTAYMFRKAYLDAVLNIAGKNERLSIIQENLLSEKEKSALFENELASQKQFVEDILNSLPGIFHLYDASGIPTIIRWNKNFETLIGYSSDEIKGRVIIDWIADENKVEAAEMVSKIIEEGEGFFEADLKRKDGTVVPYFLTGKIIDIKGQKYLVGTGYDISRKKQLEEYFYQNQKMEALGSLAGGVAHDLNNILGAVLGYSELLSSQEDLSEESAEYVSAIIKVCSRAQDFIGQIMALSRKTVSRTEVFSIKKLVEDSADFVKSSVPENTILKIELPEEDINVEADPVQINQVLINLFNNSLYAMENKNGVIGLSLSCITASPDNLLGLEPGREYVEIRIKDSGCGIAKEISSRIFDPFFSTKPKGEGSGMGLSVALGIAKKFRGNIIFESTPNAGSDFFVYLPVSYKEISSCAGAEGRGFKKGSREKIALIDDEKDLLMTGSELLKRMNYEVDVFSNGKEALTVISKNPGEYALIITDYMMPGMTGYDLAKEILSLCPSKPIILVSGFSDSLDEKSIKDCGIKYYMSKPYSAQVLSDKICELLSA
ncbi:MAG: response regulator [Spirochaetes bacterium]|nr:response regulator [Spirochaetota bacterium]